MVTGVVSRTKKLPHDGRRQQKLTSRLIMYLLVTLAIHIHPFVSTANGIKILRACTGRLVEIW